ncbi:G/T mismatch-specific thymine DNA glycosylase [Apodemus speciosus]|uniref:G/T mismatch-specific thymine DNA glycosylase n=1 Tax=Apodemus speciosus TaxID=105296 RepID=A0ABQ0F8A6_APOSI
MDAEAARSYSLEQVQASYPFPLQQMMAEVPNMAVTTGQQVPGEAPDAAAATAQQMPTEAPAQEPVPEAPKRRKRKTRAAEPQDPVEPKKPAATKKSAKSAKSKEKQEKITDAFKVKRKVDRFNGVSEAELLTKTLPDILTFNLDIVIIGINPGLMAAYKGHHYPGPGNHFFRAVQELLCGPGWLEFTGKCLFMSGLSEVQLNHMDDHTLPGKYGIGFTNMVERTTPGSKDLSSKEFREGGRILVQKLQKYQPRIAVFNGKCIYEIFSKEVFGVKVKNLEFGLQPHKIPDTETLCYVMPSSSARCAQFPRAQDKVHYYIKLKDLRDQLKGIERNTDIQEVQYTFDLQLAQEDAKKMAVKEEKYDPGYEAAYGGVYAANSVEPRGEAAPGDSEGDLPNGQWMAQSLPEQIPSFNNCGTREQEGGSHAQ